MKEEEVLNKLSNSHGTVIADVVVKVLWMFTCPFARSVVVADIVEFERTFGKTAADLVSSRPHHLRVMTHFEKIILWRAVSEIVLLQEPRLDGKHPNLCTIMTNQLNVILRLINVVVIYIPRHLMGGDENILTARTEIFHPAASDVIVDQELALISPALSIFSRFRLPGLNNFKNQI